MVDTLEPDQKVRETRKDRSRLSNTILKMKHPYVTTDLLVVSNTRRLHLERHY